MRKFTCARCKMVFDTESTQADMDVEQISNGFAHLPEEELCSICDDCYEILRMTTTPWLVP